MIPCHENPAPRSTPRSLTLALGLLLAASAAPVLAAEEAGAGAEPAPTPPAAAAEAATAPVPSAEPAAQERRASERRPEAKPDRERLRRQVEEVISIEELLAAESKAEAGKAPVSFRCEEVGPLTDSPAAVARRVTKPTFLDPRWLCYGACMLVCMGDGVPYDVCDEVCSDICFNVTVAKAPAAPADPAASEAGT